MEIPCPNCGAGNWLENQSRCLKCATILRRCTDCGNYDAKRETCRTTGGGVDASEAAHPSLLSSSTNCMSFRYVGRRA